MAAVTGAAAEPERISISRSGGVKILWKDGHQSDYGLEYLREHCPCATCTGAHGTPPAPAANPLSLYKPKLRMLDVEPVGNYAIRIKWNDGHSSGIYSYVHLRRICPCPVCTAPADPPGPAR
ncbi:MAG: DUF971 domain-containing protein [Bryobacteraceae bacterium]|jgi:DUF971 family protein|nr:DUF971 domain-containing protein [Bryobacteraceae bacterium]